MDARSHDVIAPTGQDVSLADGTTITVRPITVGQLPRFVKAVRPAFGALVALAPANSSPGAGGDQGADPAEPAGDAAEEGVDIEGMLDVYAEHGEVLTEALCIVTGEPRARIEALGLDDALQLLRALWEVNRDFFVNRLVPMLNRAR